MLTLEAVICPYCSELGSVPSQKGGFCVCHSVDPERTASQFHCTSKRPYEQESPSLEGPSSVLSPRLPHSFVYSLTAHSFTPSPHSLTHHSFPHSLLHRPAYFLGPGCPGTVLAELAVHRSQGHFLSSGGLHPSWRHRAPKRCY